jgi:hypothetical protein
MYSRANPSPRYQELTVLYRRMHTEGERFLDIPAQDTFPGLSLPPQAGRVKRLIARTGSQSILDYGAGKGRQYDVRNFKADDGQVYESIQDYWDVDYVQCYDPSYEPFSKLPASRFDGVISTDVLEHCPEDDLEWIVGEIFGFADRFVFANVACYPARKRLPTGENAHCTIRPPDWWETLVRKVAARHPGIDWEVWVQHLEGTGSGARPTESRIARDAA